mmetsp:Transcript_14240/g.21575  ORF Transcript_14240/g.21575 Transcript_14240/m.21575 type:complete len:87 (+) Transcript_14240:53-313(+)
MPNFKQLFYLSPIVLLLLLHSSHVEAKGNDAAFDFYLALDEYIIPFAKVVVACSPILIIVGMLACAQEDEETEKEKRENRKKCVKS